MKRYLLIAVILLFLGGCQALPDTSTSENHVAKPEVRSSFGNYISRDAPIWDGFELTSQYISAEDGTKLAIDMFIPTRQGVISTEPLPTVLHYTRYMRAYEDDNGVRISQGENDPILQHLLQHGFAIVVADARGTGASFGIHHGANSVEENEDSFAIVEWIADQPWSNGNVGMSGRSYPGQTQYHALTQTPPALKAIFPEMANPSPFDFVHSGGAALDDFIDVWGQGTIDADLGRARTAARVDDDIDGSERDATIPMRTGNLWAPEIVVPGSNVRDYEINRPNGGYWSWETISVLDDLDAIAESGIAIYHLVGWYDIYTNQGPWLYASLEGRVPQKMMIGPWVHMAGIGGSVHKSEILRWFDYWLKGIDNGVMDEPSVHYFIMEGNHTLPKGLKETLPTLDESAAEIPTNWIATEKWPPATVETKLWFEAGPSGTVASKNDGILGKTAPTTAGSDSYTVDYSSRVGSFSRYMNGYTATRTDLKNATYFDERTEENKKALTYTTVPFTKEMVIVGYPTIHLKVSSSHSDGDFFAYLEEVDAEGRSHYITEGVLRASHRKSFSPPPFDTLGIPYNRSYREDLAPLVIDEPVILEFGFMGTSILIDEGHRLRVTITGADATNFAFHPDLNGVDAPAIKLHRGHVDGSHIVLPVVQ